MNIEDVSKEQLIEEINRLNHRIKELELAEAERKQLRDSQSFRIGAILMEMGYLTQQQLDKYLHEQREINLSSDEYKTLGDVLVESEVITPEELHKGLAEQLRRLNNVITLYIDEKLLLESIDEIHSHGFSIESSDPEEIKEIFYKWKESEAQRKAAEKALQELEEKYRVLVENASEAILVVRGASFKFVNRHCIKLTGYSEDELTTKRYIDFIHPEDVESLVDYFTKRLRDGNSESIHSFRILDKNGKIKWVEINTVLITWSGKPAILSFMVDITGKKRSEEELKHQLEIKERIAKELEEKTEKLSQSNKELDAFIYTASHDLKAPLVSIHGFSAMLAKDYSERLDENGRLYIDRILKNSEYMGVLIDNLLELSRIGRIKDKEGMINVSDVISDVAAEISSQMEKRGTRLIVKGKMPILHGDRTRISQIFANLISNANKFMGDDNSKPTIEVGCDIEDGYYRFYVKDNGIGIDKEYHDTIFQIFQRLNDIETEGTGVGLAIVKKIVENIGGSIWVDSARGKGTTVYFTIPTILGFDNSEK